MMAYTLSLTETIKSSNSDPELSAKEKADRISRLQGFGRRLMGEAITKHFGGTGPGLAPSIRKIISRGRPRQS